MLYFISLKRLGVGSVGWGETTRGDLAIEAACRLPDVGGFIPVDYQLEGTNHVRAHTRLSARPQSGNNDDSLVHEQWERGSRASVCTES